jgi:hypothetical protein
LPGSENNRILGEVEPQPTFVQPQKAQDTWRCEAATEKNAKIEALAFCEDRAILGSPIS